MKYSTLISASLLLAAAPALAAPAASNSDDHAVKPITANPARRVRRAVPSALDADDPENNYVVVMAANENRPWPEIFDEMGFNTSDTTLRAQEALDYSFGKQVGEIRTFGTSMRAFTMRLHESEAEAMGDADNIRIIEKDSIVDIPAIIPATVGPQQMTADSFSFEPAQVPAAPPARTRMWGMLGIDRLWRRQTQGQVTQQASAPWNLARVSTGQNRVVPNGRRVGGLGFRFQFDSTAGSGVDVYMLDTGMNVRHQDFGGRARTVFSAFNDDGRDNEGHGTHTAGTVGSRTFGVAKNVNLLNVKVLEPRGRGSFAAVLQGIDASIQRHNQRKGQAGFQGSIISMSLGGRGTPQSMLMMLQKATQAGVHVSVAAGNDNTDACGFNPAAFSRQIPIITVGATDVNDNKASFSNFGSCVDIHAPGTQVLSTWNNGPQGTNVIQGTSMACPAVSGLIADMLVKNPNLRLNPAGMKQLLLSRGNRVRIAGSRGGEIMLSNGLRATA
ncbi:hypothetical protein DRE_01435 [Drechslerella stenobrocha 248]|uniref:Peptidase S8/S53 domain-containing protein n=1 Tax=Drechslerella stenobrocha 248 TaxID=1043628 RepID=W7HUN7_9PEZI|nr:hypothetical protein DRE_01435 [Drechslerella stenobrocha 248]